MVPSYDSGKSRQVAFENQYGSIWGLPYLTRQASTEEIQINDHVHFEPMRLPLPPLNDSAAHSWAAHCDLNDDRRPDLTT